MELVSGQRPVCGREWALLVEATSGARRSQSVLDGTLDPSPVFDMTVGLEGVPDGYAAMNQRKALKVFVRI